MTRPYALAIGVGLALMLGIALQRGGAQVQPTETLTFVAVADTWVDASAPTKNYDSDARLRADASPERVAYLRFRVAGVSGRRVEQARLRLHVTGPSDATGGTVHLISSNTWDERTLTWSARPPVDGAGLDTLGPVAEGTWVEFNLDGEITGDGTYSLAVTSSSGDGVSYESTAGGGGAPPTIALTVQSSPEPVVTIVQPPDGSTFFVGDAVPLQAVVTDDLDLDLASLVEWRSSRDGVLGTGASIVSPLSAGDHAVTALVTDSDGFTGADQIGISIIRPPGTNTEPLVTITVPLDGEAFPAGAPIVFTGSATDLEDGVLTPRLAWSSDRDGHIGDGGTFAATLSEGTHDVTARVTDSGGLVGSATASLSVVPSAPLEFAAVADTYVAGNNKTTSFGSSTELRIDSGPEMTSYLRFVVSGVGERHVARAMLTLRVGNTSEAGGDRGGTVHAISDTKWDERSVTYWTRPPVDGPALDSAGGVAAGATVAFDVTSTVTGDGTYSFALVADSGDMVSYRSREAGGPKLVLTLGGHGPTVAITEPANGTAVHTGDLPLTFRATALDAEDGDLGSEIRWTSDRDGVLGRGAAIAAMLSLGQHLVTAAVTDSQGARGAAQVSVTVRSGNTAPVVRIESPADGAVVVPPVDLRATASDAEEGDLSARITWTSSLDGILGTGGRLTVANLSSGEHTLRASVTDGSGASASATVTVRVTSSTLAVGAEADTYVDADRPTAVLGAEDVLRADASPVREIYFRFRPSGIAPFAVGRAVLRLTVGSDSGNASERAGSVHVLAPTSWAEATTTYANRPRVEGAAIASGGAVAVDEVVEFDVTAAVSRDGAYDFAVVSSSTDGVGYRSREAAAGRPLLVITLESNTPPSVHITDPPAQTTVEPATPLTLAATATDVHDGDIGARIVWSSNRSGPLGTGSRIAVLLEPGVHTITARATDSGGLVDEDTVTVVVASRPAVTITAPADGTTVFREDLPLWFDGTAIDAEDGDLSSALVWTSDRDGTLGTGRSTSARLSVGVHTITARVTDSGGLTGQASITVRVRIENEPPQVTITAPADGAVIPAGTPTDLRATATDDSDTDLDDRITWTSDRAGILGTGASLTVSLGEGVHTLTAAVADIEGAAGATSISVTAFPTTRVFTSDADTYVDDSQPHTPLGSESTVRVDASPEREAYLRFTVTGIRPLAIGRAVLRLTVGPESSHGSANGGTVRALSDNGWSEGSTTFATRPDVDGPTLDSQGAVDPDSIVEFDVTGGLRADGTYSFALVTSSSDAVGYRSREATTGRPQLIVTLKENAPPAVEITAPAPGTVVLAGSEVRFAARAADAEDGELGAEVRWRSDRDGVLGAGGELTVTGLSQGLHTVTAEVTDSSGASGAATIMVAVDAPPVLTMSSPADGSSHFTTDRVTFAVVATDAVDGDLSPQVTWTSSLDGLLGTGASIVTTLLSAGPHVVTAAVVNSRGIEGAASVRIAVEVNDPPAIAITAPADGTHIVAGTPLTLAAMASDPEQGDISAAILWSSHRDGPLGTGSQVEARTLSVGTHLIQAAASDNRNLTASATITVSVEANDPPLVTVRAPAAGSRFHVNQQVEFSGAAVDPEDGDLTAGLLWGSNRDGLIGTGPGFVTDGLSVGTHTVTAVAIDTLGLAGSTGVSIEIVNDVPRIAIAAPTDGLVTIVGNPVLLSGTAADTEDGDLGDVLVWTSSRDGLLGQGPRLVRSLTRGSHTISAQATDGAGAVGSATVAVRVDPIPSGTGAPVVTISEPEDQSVISSGLPIRLAAMAVDPDDGNISHLVVWGSDLDGTLGTGAALLVDWLSIGVHRITATVTDRHGVTRWDEITLEIIDGVPRVQIRLPEPDSGFLTGIPVSFFADAVDVLDGDVSQDLIWTSDLDGIIGTGRTFVVGTLSAGIHTVTAAARNGRGGTGTADVRIIVSPPTVVYPATADSYVDETLPDTNFGSDTTLLADGAPGIRDAYLRFEVTGIEGLRLRQAHLRLEVSGKGGSDFGGTVHTFSNGDGWTERGITFHNRPAIDGPALTTVGVSVEPNEIVDFDVSAALAGDGAYSFAIVSPSADGVRYKSRETGTTGPELVVDLGQAPVQQVPEIAIVQPASGVVVLDDTPITFTAVATDAEDGDLGMGIQWSSDHQGALGSGAALSRRLDRGVHVVTAAVSDSFGLRVSAAVTVTVVDRPPAVAITSPTNGSFFPGGFPITLTGSAFDDTDGDMSAAIRWTSHRDGVLGTGAALVIGTLSSGDHVIVGEVTNSLGTVGAEAVAVFIDHAPPEVTIQAPGSGSTVGEGTPVTLTGVASDVEDGDLSHELVWSSDIEGRLGIGASLRVALLAVGTHRISAVVTDSHDFTRSDTITLTVTPAAPVVTITAPLDGSKVTGAVAFAGTAIDVRDGDVSGNLQWMSSIDGMLGTGAAVPSRNLTIGPHVITAAATDREGLRGSASVSIVVGVAPPLVEIIEPVSSAGLVTEATVDLGEAVTFRATAVDSLGGSLSESLRWRSDLNGLLGTGPSVTLSTLVRGRHLVSAEVTDRHGLTGTAQIVVLVTVLPSSSGPSVTISSPARDDVLGVGMPVTFTASAVDGWGADRSAGLSWVSSRDGLLGRGASITAALRSTGTHAITAAVLEPNGAVGSATISVPVVEPFVRFEAVADTYDDQSQALTNFGASPELHVDLSPESRVYLRFTVSGTGVLPIERAVLRLQTTSQSDAGSDHGGRVRRMSDTTWKEMTLAHANAPAVDGPELGSIGPVVPSQSVEIDVTGVVRSDGSYAFAISAASEDEAVYRSREASVGAPELVVFFEPPVVERPTVDILEPANGATFPTGTPAVLKGTADDLQDGDLDVAIIWRSNVDGILGIGPSITRVLRAGPHVITATVNDVDGNAGADLVYVHVGARPSVVLQMPASGTTVRFGEPLLFAATASDPQDGDLSPFIEWRSDLDGQFGVGPSIAARLSPGTHIITASVTDNAGNSGSATLTVSVSASDVGFRDLSFGAGVDQDGNRVTAAKPESKLWYADGIWWATLFDPAAGAYVIHRLDLPTQTWVATGIPIDDRPLSRQDALLDGDTLYIASRMSVPGGQNRLYRYTYDRDVQLFLPEPGFPVSIPGGGTESLTVAKDSTGRLWIAYTLDDQVSVSHTIATDADWADPFVVPVADHDPAATQVSFDDIAAVTALEGAVGVFWSNQLTKQDYFAVHADGAPPAHPASWRLEVAATGGAIADDHFNMKLARDGRLFVAVKTSFTKSSATLVGLLVRRPDGTWSALHHVTSAEFSPTRPLCLLDEVRRRVHVFYSPFEGAIFTKSSDMDAIAFPDPTGMGRPFITSSTAGFINNPTSTKQNVNPATGLVVAAAGKSAYWHNAIEPEPAPVVTITQPQDGRAVAAGSAITFAATAFSVSDGTLTDQLGWESSRDGAIGAGGEFTTSMLSVGEHLITASVTDSTLLTGRAAVRLTVASEAPPVVTIDQPTDGGKLLFGSAAILTGTAMDVLDGDRTSGLEWTSDRDGTLGTGGSVTAGGLSLGSHLITARAVDSAGLVGSASVGIDVQVQAPPAVTIGLPEGNVTVPFGGTVTFAGVASDAFDGDLTASLRWSSDRDGAIGTGGRFPRSSLSVGVHAITASATDSHGLTGSAVVTVTVDGSAVATPPEVTIDGPADGTVITVGDAVTFRGTGIDALEGDVSARLTWASDRHGVIGTGAQVTTAALGAGTHTVSARVTNSLGIMGQARVTVVVNTPPAVVVVAPAGGASLLAGRPIVLGATATDAEDGQLAAAVQWKSDRDGALGTGGLLTVGGLSAGSHTLAARVTDRAGALAEARVTVTVAPATLTLGAEADTYVDESRPALALGSEDTFRADASPRREAFLRFRVGEVTPFVVDRATLRLTVGPNSSHGSAAGGEVHPISANGWSEQGMTFATRPVVDGPAIATAGAVAAGRAVDFDITSAVRSAGVYSVALVTSSSDGVGYSSREASSSGDRPRLLLTLAQETAPVVIVMAPLSGRNVPTGSALTLSAKAADAQDGDLSTQVAWRSDLQGALGAGASVTVTLGAGRHRITARVVDHAGREGQAEVVVEVSGS